MQMSMTNCVNCGSAKDADAKVCPFCGTSYFDLTDIDLDCHHMCVVRFKIGDKVFTMKAYLRVAEFHYDHPMIDISSIDERGRRFIPASEPQVTAKIEFVGVN